MRNALTGFSSALSRLVARAVRAVVTVAGETRDADVHGSGFVIEDEGYLVTNEHVVRGLQPPIEILVSGGAHLLAGVIGVDRPTDLALLRLDKPVGARLRLRSEPARPGELCLALGTPLGRYVGSASLGVISGISRNLLRECGPPIVDALQTDAAINAGNSGGPLIDVAGRVLGVNHSSDLRGQRISFAIPAATAKWVVAQLRATGRVRRATLGVLVRKTRTETSGRSVRGLQVVSVERQERRGLETGDVILRVGRSRVHEPSHIYAALSTKWIGKPVPVDVIRGDCRHTIVVTPRELNEKGS